jgi:Protein of unknown function (DUF2442)
MLKDVVFAEKRENYSLYICFEDGVEGIVDLSQFIKFTGVFAPLQEPEYFASFKVNSDIGTVEWESGADIDPDVLYAVIINQPIPNYQLTLIQP